MKTRSGLAGAVLLGMFVGASANTMTAVDNSVTFDVFLDDSRIGYHRFDFDDPGGEGAGAVVTSEAKFDVKFLFITAFRYRHTAAERWVGGCLDTLDARTNANGKRLEVTGERTDSGFVVNNGAAAESLPDCVMTFAYWNPGFLEQSRLLNPQTGEYLDVDIEPLGPDAIRLSGEQVAAERYRVTARNTDLMVWYSPDKEWLALESVAKGGRIIRYERS